MTASTDRATSRFLLRTPPELHRRLRRECGHRGTSLNSLCVSLLEAGLSRTAAPEAGPWEPWVAKARALHRDDLVGVVLFGSVARGEDTEGSDVDLLLVLSDEVPIARTLYRKWDESEPTDDRVSPHFTHLPSSGAAAGSLWIEVAIDGSILIDPARVLAQTLSSLRRDLASGKFRLGTAHGQRYWIHRAKEETDAQ